MRTDDGAHEGVAAEAAMKAAIGGEQPASVQTVQEMAASIMAVTPDDANTYDGCARYAAKLIMEWLLEDPSRAAGPTENVYELGDDGRMVWPAVVVTAGWYDRMKEDGHAGALEQLGLTGFQWGWAVNAARRCVELPPVPNPAIVTIGAE